MKGIVFTEFLEMVEARFGLGVVDAIIQRAELGSEGVYTAVGTYDAGEMFRLVSELEEEVQVPVTELLRSFGHYLFDSLVRVHPEVVSSYRSPLALLSSIEDHIHVHVNKLYPDAELPSFQVLSQHDHSMELIYTSSRALSSLALGLMEKTFDHFGQQARIEMESLNEDGTRVKFAVTQYAY